MKKSSTHHYIKQSTTPPHCTVVFLFTVVTSSSVVTMISSTIAAIVAQMCEIMDLQWSCASHFRQISGAILFIIKPISTFLYHLIKFLATFLPALFPTIVLFIFLASGAVTMNTPSLYELWIPAVDIVAYFRFIECLYLLESYLWSPGMFDIGF